MSRSARRSVQSGLPMCLPTWLVWAHLMAPCLLAICIPPSHARAQRVDYDASDFEGGYEHHDGALWLGQPGNDGEYLVQEGDTLWGVSQRVYGDPARWPELWSYNPEITNPHWIYPAGRLRLWRGVASVRSNEIVQPSASETGHARRAPIVSRSRKVTTTFLLRDQGYLDADALEKAGVIEGASEERMMLATGDEVYIKLPKREPVRAGQQYTIFREMPKVERVTGEEGRLVRIYGTLDVLSYDPARGQARAVITEAVDPVERGDSVAVMVRRFERVQPLRSDVDVEGRVVATLRPRILLADEMLLFLNIGADAGVRPGYRIFVVRKGDRWHQSLQQRADRMGAITTPTPYDADRDPLEDVAEGRVVHVNAKTSAVLITQADGEVEMGDTVEIRAGVE